ncbi:hypothetical protein BUALT_Bualt07G0125800 [Buddleja alternifolia]|uniref:Uncharacterized protein n=1 Tax=Buddleja alternifolia TaxID=168488 RepID=A0AAV6XB78_9LAMI|nr:hypothetical protein BUALT_Bualt07G0124900 [Buddleja alternifolia]KAG8379788.1 hypothetical protein BUALT_Bualt07G0125800 [Buddleja alternifolia]
MSYDPYVVEAGTSRGKQPVLESRASSSNHMAAEKSYRNLILEDGHSCSRKAEMKRLEGRLRVLEEEAEMLKGAFLESVEGRRKLMSEIYEHFETIQKRELERAELHTHGKNRRAGLLQVLWQESNPSLVNRGLRANALGYHAT